MASEARVTLADLAEKAGVSLATASKVLNGRRDVAPGTRQRVEQLLDQHGYRRRAPSQSNSRLIELLFHELESAWSMEIIRGVEDIASERGLSVVLSESGKGKAPGSDWLEGVLGRRPVGVVLVVSDLPAEYRSALATRSIPFVLVDPAGDPAIDVPAVGSANWAGGLAAVRHLIELGHKRIAAISGPGGHDVLARPDRRLPLGDECGRTADPPRVDPVRRLPPARRCPACGRAARPPGAAYRHLRRQRPAGPRRARDRPRSRDPRTG